MSKAHYLVIDFNKSTYYGLSKNLYACNLDYLVTCLANIAECKLYSL